MPIDTLDAIQVAARYGAARTGLMQLPYTSLFRYVGLDSEIAWRYLEETVIKNRLVLAKANFLNDPFDNNPIIVNDLEDPASQIPEILNNVAKHINQPSLSTI